MPGVNIGCEQLVCVQQLVCCIFSNLITLNNICLYKNLAIANRSRVSCARNTLRASIGIHITLTLKSRLRVTQGH